MVTQSEPEAEDLKPPTLVGPRSSLSPSTGAFDGLALEIIHAARAKLVEIEVDLRDLWYDSVELAPVLAARVNTAVRFAHHAAEALAEETLL